MSGNIFMWLLVPKSSKNSLSFLFYFLSTNNFFVEYPQEAMRLSLSGTVAVLFLLRSSTGYEPQNKKLVRKQDRRR